MCLVNPFCGNPPGRSGFTLLEVTIAVAIATVMFGILGYSISSAAATTHMVQMTSDLDQTAHRVLDRIVNDLRSSPKGLSVLAKVESISGTVIITPNAGDYVFDPDMNHTTIQSTLGFRSFKSFSSADLSTDLTTNIVAYPPNAPAITIAVRNNAYASADAPNSGDLVRTVWVGNTSSSETLAIGVSPKFAAATAQLGTLSGIVDTTDTPGFFAVLDKNADPSGHILSIGLTLGGTDSQGHWITRSAWTQVHLDTP
jgi:prepilin-type N-terminal cleavage/methylation domain-containing protein